MTKELLMESVAERSVLQMATSSLETLSALIGLTALGVRPRPAPAPAQPTYTLNEVSEHCWADDCWLVLYDRVYDVTRFLSLHPAGSDIMLESAGRDATSAFHGVGHSKEALDMLKEYQIGVLVPEECMWDSAK
ncbi:cytochrome b5 type B-like [Amphibalanus amphitrite]|nr:cytochrome b5 type B-like [Amphibalanus amphitrite]XP_043197134.1 cytochrome b5 type B-like [Amphibalanus amphitrite]